MKKGIYVKRILPPLLFMAANLLKKGGGEPKLAAYTSL